LGEARLVAKALGFEREAAKRIKALATPEGLRIGVVQHAYQLKIKGMVTHARLRAALAAVALSRAFGDQLDASLAGKLALSARAERLLAGQLARKRRDFGTDRRLIAALAGEQTGLARADPAALKSAVLARYLGIANGPILARQRTAERAAAGRSRPLEPASPAAGRPDLASFAREVRALALGSAQGWVGDRKAYISHVWRRLRERRPEWGLSEIEFKCMLAQAHRSGELLLAIADLKDHNNLRDVEESALVYKNAVFHFVRVGV
jgi:hypothetical protein